MILRVNSLAVHRDGFRLAYTPSFLRGIEQNKQGSKSVKVAPYLIIMLPFSNPHTDTVVWPINVAGDHWCIFKLTLEQGALLKINNSM